MDSKKKCSLHKETKIEALLTIENKIYISSYCFSCWVNQDFKKEMKKFERQLKKSNLMWIRNLFSLDKPNFYEFEKLYRGHANNEKKKAKKYKEELRQQYYKKNPPTNLDEILKLNGVEFENYIKFLFQKQGFNISKTPESRNVGIDLVITKKINSRINKTAVHCKSYKKSIGVSAVQEIFNGQHLCKCSESIIITTSEFTTSAIKKAKDLKVELWDKTRLVEEIKITVKAENNSTLSWDEFLAPHLVEDKFPPKKRTKKKSSSSF
ncbi:restriction endonuclease [Bacillus sp. sid0103]|uniref:restriction endonuclease n=1 Tax=Bacillus sp. sid0103 TaxID=2856337 RepID=UPI001C4801D5|nr:restriction endonuclease [Bacillus sp. sid0103]MBV7509705.1 restriction endonuclease [Bacillus sp. sid0103]